ncbi:hypothetical protein CROQUDRAFT_359464 [Cronartium quercuum f. sp. fusiforme G11]|uniref:Copper acquisition factor BIM1-like domain-containing protein n=1 Tax=Cronartium quercuum f. sp. fusiforme G11 TaxID=708437 RepID=A0A9P6NL02_9BASI|nr:hypothetical protein CROQUDRAFT_359464 [Cronartium quercuum f. sp. fusiforme G11]
MIAQLKSVLLVGLFLASIVSAHFTLDYPPTRGFDEDKEPNFCGGFPTNGTGRHLFPLSGPVPILIGSHHQSAQVAIILSLDADPQTFEEFNGTNEVNFLMPFGTIQGQGEFCFTVDISTLADQLSPPPVNGSLATLQVEFNGGDGLLFQCSDLILIQGLSTPNTVTCANSTTFASSSISSNSTSSSVQAHAAHSTAGHLQISLLVLGSGIGVAWVLL